MTRGKTYRAEAVIDLPAVLLLGSDFPGLLKPAVIGGVEVHVVLPDFNKSGTETVLHPRAKSRPSGVRRTWRRSYTRSTETA